MSSDSENEVQERLRNRRRRNIIEEDEEDEDEEGLDEFEKDDFMVEDNEDEEEEVEKPRVKKKLRKKRAPSEEMELDEEDLDLIQENTGLTFETKTSKLKRLQRKREIEEEEEMEEEHYRPGRDTRNDDLGDMFNDEDEGAGGYGEEDYGDGLDDFIEHDLDEEEDEVGGTNDMQAMMQRRAEQRRRQSEKIKAMRTQGKDIGAHDILLEVFGDGADYEWAFFDPDTYKTRTKDAPQASLKAAFEPGELAARMMTEKDEVIRNLDVPERMQERYGSLYKNPPTEQEMSREVKWVLDRFCDPSKLDRLSEVAGNANSDTFRTAIKSCVNFFNLELLEVPFIWHFRKDYFIDPMSRVTDMREVLDLQDIWRAYDLDWKYKQFNSQYNKFNENLPKFEAAGRTDDYVLSQIQSVTRVEEIQDIIDYINTMYPAQNSNDGFHDPNVKVYRRPNRSSFLERCQRARLGDLVPRFGITPQKYGINAFEGQMVFHSQDPDMSPIEAASTFVCDLFPSPELVLKAVKSYIAQMMFYDLKLRQSFRASFENISVVTCRPTSKGVLEIDTQHRFFSFKFLQEKPVVYLKDPTFLSMLEAESMGLITMNISVPRKADFTDRLVRLYFSQGTAPNSSTWNETRKEIVELACYEYIYPHFEDWIRDKLKAQAEEYLVYQFSQALNHRFGMGKYINPNIDPKALPRVIAITNGSGHFRDPSVAVYVNEKGKVIEAVEFADLRDEGNRIILSSFFDRHHADVIVGSGFNLSVKMFIDKVRAVYQESQMGLNNPIEIFLQSDEVARIYYQSKAAEAEFPNHLPMARYCISLARLLQDPVMEYAALKEDLPGVNFHPLQRLLPKNLFNMCVERAFVNAVNGMGVDINRATKEPRVANLLQYVAGLGPRKAQQMLQKVNALPSQLESRADLVLKQLVSKNVFINCSGFLIVKPYSDILDITRVHPEDYSLARKMAADAMDVDEEFLDDHDHPSRNVAELISNPRNILNDLDLEDYSRVLVNRYNSSKMATLNLVKAELHQPYMDLRPPFQPTAIDVLFSELSGETPETLYPQMLVPVEVLRVLPRIVICKLNSGLDGIMPLRNVPNASLLQPGMIIQAAVTAVNLDRFNVELSMQDNDLAACKLKAEEYYGKNGDGVDRYFAHQVFQKEIIDHPEMHPNLPRPERVNKSIPNPTAAVHNLFRMLGYKDAEKYLSSRKRGEMILRPSSRGAHHIAITWKFHEGVYQHLDVVEEVHPDYPNAPPKLRLENQYFADLDELTVNYVEAASRMVDEMCDHPKFHKGTPKLLEEYIVSSSLAQPKQSIYGFCVSHEQPGTFCLGFKLSGKSRYTVWLVKVVPRYFILNRVSYPGVQELINGFKMMVGSMASQSHQQPQNMIPHHQYQQPQMQRNPMQHPHQRPLNQQPPNMHPNQHPNPNYPNPHHGPMYNGGAYR